MRETWLKLVDNVLRPARPRLERCERERQRHLDERRAVTEVRARAIANCVARIESTRAAVFAADDGVVSSRMTDLEREWRLLSRPDPDAGLMDLWARIAPDSWMDRKRWRDSDRDARLDAAIALAADVEGVEAAEAAIASLRTACAAWGIPIGARIRWRSAGPAADSDGTTTLLAGPLRVACEELSARGVGSVAVERAREVERAVYHAASVRFPERELLARALAHAAFVDDMSRVWRAASRGSAAARPNPVTSLRDLWTTGYVLSGIDASAVTVELPPL